ncbi:hypothetical protein F5Y15DRAFT_386932 [Xylariaceae sp. FL0016]|nr:hypothetical protein F5Y15DRAFT_386932 [Xylariaceae sp. FL0016]
MEAIEQVEDFVGWVDTPNVRGTVDIIYSSLVVLITAIWTVLHLNIPLKTESWGRVMWRRARWGFLAIFAPDLLTMIAASQWLSASKSVRDMARLSEADGWTLEHAFYANSGGFLLEPKDEPAFPVNAECIHYLVSHGYMPLPKITCEEIWDKSKADRFAKAFALLQISWMIIQAVARASQRLALSPLELFTLAFVVSTAMSYFFWWHKPQHVETPTTLPCSFSTAKIRADAGLPAHAPWEDTPLDFVQKAAQVWERRRPFRSYDLEKQGPSVREEEEEEEKRTPVQRIPDDAILPTQLPLSVLASLVVPSMIHSCIHLLAWNQEFPTTTERLLWRISAVVLASVSCFSVGMVRVLAILGYRGKYNLSWLWVNVGRVPPAERRWPDIWDYVQALSVLSLVVARCYIIVEAIFSLRHLPANVYVTVSWTNFIPHI